jgi:transmembrane sensor
MAPPPVIYETEVGERRLAALADGSVLHLDAASRVRADVGGSRRRVELLAGRARFDVAKDSWRRPFRVEAGGINVTALGTLFDVRLNAADVRVALFEGAVEVRREADSAQAVRLRPGQGLVAPADGGPFHLKNVEDAQAESWTEGRLMFSGVPLSSVAEELNRYSRRKLIVESSALGDKQFRGVLAAGDIDAAAEANDAALAAAEAEVRYWSDNPPPVKGRGSGAVVVVDAETAQGSGSALSTGGN